MGIRLEGGAILYPLARVLLPIFLAVILSFLIGKLPFALAVINQKKINRAAQDLFAKPKAERRFVLYLRSFDADEPLAEPQVRLSVKSVFSDLTNAGMFGVGTWLATSVKRRVAELDPNSQVVALAGRSVFVGAGQIVNPRQDWKHLVAALCDEARAVVFVVGGSTGLSWELGHVLNTGHSAKTVFILPPWELMQRYYGVAAEVIALRARDIFLSHGVALPQPSHAGTVFMVNNVREISYEQKIRRWPFTDKALPIALATVLKKHV